MLVIKLGGSLYGSPHLQEWLDQIAASNQPIIIVPGGGPFADQVRDAQKQHPINDADAHHMALLAMAQFGLLLCGLHPKLTPCYFSNNEPINSDNIKVWIPSRHLLNELYIVQSWDVSADSLALWLAQEINASKLLIVKSSPLPAPPLTVEKASKMQLLDTAFPDHYKRQAIPTTLMHASQSIELDNFLSNTAHSSLALS